MEIWKNIPGFEGEYQASNLGKIKSLTRKYSVLANGKYPCEKTIIGRVLKKRVSQGRSKVALKGKNYSTHRLVAITFLENPNNYPQINHIDGNPLNNVVENLEWCNRSMNIKHAYKNKLIVAPKGEKSHLSKLKEKDVKLIRLIRPYYSTVELAKRFNINQRTISAICNRIIWKHI
jgi:hypothetical protein